MDDTKCKKRMKARNMYRREDEESDWNDWRSDALPNQIHMSDGADAHLVE